MSYLPIHYNETDIFAIKTLTIRPELHLVLSSGTVSDRTKRCSSTEAPMFELSYTRKGLVCGEVENTLVEVQPGHALVGFMGSVCGHAEYSRGENVRLCSIWASPRAFNGFCEAVSGRSDYDFQDFQTRAYSSHSFRMDMCEERALSKLDSCLFNEHDSMNLLMAESCVLELLSINLECLLCEGLCKKHTCNLSRTEIDSLKYAKEIILSRLDSPPTLMELSRLVQLNDFKLKREFKRFYGRTVYGYIREQRLEKALSLLELGKCNVSEAAFTVGYSNVSHFSEAFKKKYGILPSIVKK